MLSQALENEKRRKVQQALRILILLREQAEIRNSDCLLQRVGESLRFRRVGWMRRLDGARQVHLRRGHGQTVVGMPDEPVPVAWPEQVRTIERMYVHAIAG